MDKALYHYTAFVQRFPKEYHYYCTSKNQVLSGEDIRDHIGLSIYNVTTGQWEMNHGIMLQPGISGQWDEYHVCDPEVLKGRFLYKGTTYTYAMFYTGMTGNSFDYNSLGVAFSKSYTGPWVKYDKNPLVKCATSATCIGAWGVGQPAATSVDGAGRMLLFYTVGDRYGTRAYRIDANLSNMDNPVLGIPIQLPTAGLIDRNGQQDWLNNFGIVYDGYRDRFLMARGRHPTGPEHPDVIASEIQVNSISGTSIWTGQGQWSVLGNISHINSGKPRNHNAGILRDPYGGMVTSDRLYIIHAVSDINANVLGALHSYKLYRNDGILK